MRLFGSALLAPVLRYAGRLRFPWLFALTATLFVIDLLIPDFIPFADELLLGFVTLLLGSWRHRNEAPELDSEKTESQLPK